MVALRPSGKEKHMDHRIKLTNGELLLRTYHSNFDCFINGEYRFPYVHDGDEDFTTKENIDSFIENKLENYIDITSEDEDKLVDVLTGIFYPHSSEIYL
jgi:hypothetical protein